MVYQIATLYRSGARDCPHSIAFCTSEATDVSKMPNEFITKPIHKNTGMMMRRDAKPSVRAISWIIDSFVSFGVAPQMCTPAVQLDISHLDMLINLGYVLRSIQRS